MAERSPSKTEIVNPFRGHALKDAQMQVTLHTNGVILFLSMSDFMEKPRWIVIGGQPRQIPMSSLDHPEVIDIALLDA
jgi:hypothetical protein